MNLKQLLCRHKWEEYDTRMVIVVACPKCKRIASIRQAVRLLQAGKVKRLGR